MSRQSLLKRFELKPKPAKPHRPLLVLYALGQWQQHRSTRVGFRAVERDLKELLQRFGQGIDVYHPDQPFCALERELKESKDKLWVIDAPSGLKLRKRGFYDPGALRKKDVKAGFTDGVLADLRADPSLVSDVARYVLEQWAVILPECFHDSKHQQILSAVGLSGRGSPIDLPEPSSVRSGGAGFGNPETNKEVETTAVTYVSNWYARREWSVRSVERDRCGFDLECRRGMDCEHVEVKGVSGMEESFTVTAGEVRRAGSDPEFVLCVVTSALTKPRLNRYSGVEFLARFALEPIQFQATPKLQVGQS